MTKLSVTFGLLSLALFGYAGYRWATDRDDPPQGEALVVEVADFDLGERAEDSTVPVTVRLRNASSRELRVLGLVPG